VRNTTVFFGLRTEKRLFSSTTTRHSGPPNNNMKYSTVEYVLASFPHPILPSAEGEPDYQTIHATRKLLQANSRSIDTHLGGGTLGHLGLIGTDIVGITKRPRAGTSNNGWNSGPTQRSSPRLGRICADLSYMHLRPASFEETNHWSLRAHVLGDLEQQHGGLRQHLSKRHVGPPL
jgi:hypothetical protein